MDSAQAFELADIDAVGQGALVSAGELSAVELLDAAIIRLEAARDLNAVIARPVRPRACAGRRIRRLGSRARRRIGSVGRGAVPAQGSRRFARGYAGGDGLTGLAHSCRDGDSVDRRPLPVGGTGGVRQDEYPRVGQSLHHRAVAVRPDRQSRGRHRSPRADQAAGSASAVAAGVVPAASGGDGTGSIRVPASCCGLVGLKPRRGRSSFAPGAGHALEGLVNAHALTRTVRDSAALLDVIAGSAPGDPYAAPPPTISYLDAIAERPAYTTYSAGHRLAVPGHPDRSRRRGRRRGRRKPARRASGTPSKQALPQSIPTSSPTRSRFCTPSATLRFMHWRRASSAESRPRTSSSRARG